MSTPESFTPADVAAVIQAARVLGKGGAGPLPALSEHLSRIADKCAAAIEAAAHAHLPGSEMHFPAFDPTAPPADRAEAEADL